MKWRPEKSEPLLLKSQSFPQDAKITNVVSNGRRCVIPPKLDNFLRESPDPERGDYTFITGEKRS
jgi:hypothetical protein